MKATPLYKQGAAEPFAWLCGSCNYGGRVLFDTEASAEAHCRCDHDGCPERRAEHLCYCKAHEQDAAAERERQAARNEAARFAKAKKITAAEYTGRMVYDPAQRGSGEGYFNDVSEVEDYYADQGEPAPAYVWATTENHFHTDAQGVIDHELENAGVDSDLFDFDTDSLQDLLDGWWAEHGRPFYEADHSIAILIEAAVSQ